MKDTVLCLKTRLINITESIKRWDLGISGSRIPRKVPQSEEGSASNLRVLSLFRYQTSLRLETSTPITRKPHRGSQNLPQTGFSRYKVIPSLNRDLDDLISLQIDQNIDANAKLM